MAERILALPGDGIGPEVVAEALRALEAAAAGAENIEAIEREARNHWRLEEAGGVAAEADARALALVRLRPPPVFNFQYERVVRQSFRGPVLIAADAQVIEP